MENQPGSIKNSLSNCDDKAVQDVISKNKFVAKIKVGEKIDVRSMTIISASSWGSSAYRTIIARDESRESTLAFLQSLTNSSLELACSYFKKDEEYFDIIGKLIITSIKDTIPGLNNLSKTYELDRYYVSELDTLVQMIETKTSDVIKFYSK
jgi:hypothetical protein